jgi:hypothetical protein
MKQKCILALSNPSGGESVPVILLYDQQVEQFRLDNDSAAIIPLFDRGKSSFYEHRSLGMHWKFPGCFRIFLINMQDFVKTSDSSKRELQ